MKQGELNVDVLDGDAAQKLADWFEQRWQDSWCLDITEELADIIENSWAGGPIKPYEIYIKTAYELSKEAIEGAREFKVPKIFRDTMLAFQSQAVSLAAERLNHHDGVIISDVVGLGKTLIASAVAKTFPGRPRRQRVGDLSTETGRNVERLSSHLRNFRCDIVPWKISGIGGDAALPHRHH